MEGANSSKTQSKREKNQSANHIVRWLGVETFSIVIESDSILKTEEKKKKNIQQQQQQIIK